MTARKPFLLRLDPATFEALQAWAADDLRSVNGQAEFLLRRSLREAGRLRTASGTTPGDRGEPDAPPLERHTDAATQQEAMPVVQPPGHVRRGIHPQGSSANGAPRSAKPSDRAT